MILRQFMKTLGAAIAAGSLAPLYSLAGTPCKVVGYTQRDTFSRSQRVRPNPSPSGGPHSGARPTLIEQTAFRKEDCLAAGCSRCRSASRRSKGAVCGNRLLISAVYVNLEVTLSPYTAPASVPALERHRTASHTAPERAMSSEFNHATYPRRWPSKSPLLDTAWIGRDPSRISR
mgnify:CR=1 FL=1